MRPSLLICALASLFSLTAAAPIAPTAPPPVTAKRIEAPAQVPVKPTAPQLTREDLDAWLDGLIPPVLARGDIAGAVVVIVKDGRPLLQKGYGYADVARRIPVDPDATLFRPGSISKLFTWTAAMQLVEEGKLDLDADINSYLDFRVEGRGGKPITMRHLMTHTAGFEETVKDLIGTDPQGPVPLREYLSRWIPARLYRPGTTPAYSNYGTALAGYIVQRASGEPSYDAYIDKHIFRRLGMTRSTFRQPVPKGLQPLVSKGYYRASDDPLAYEMVAVSPAGSLATTGSDMSRFMIAHLENGAYGDARILRPDTARKMHETAMSPVPPLHIMRLGFIDFSRNGRRIIGHGGDSLRFHSGLELLMDEGVGIYISLNSSGRDGAAVALRDAFATKFVDRYFPAPAGTARPASIGKDVAIQHAQQVAGVYEISRRPSSKFMSLTSLLMSIKVVAQEDGTVIIPLLTDDSGNPKVWREIAPYVWAEDGGPERFGVKFENGKVAMFGGGTSVLVPLPWWRSGAWLLPATAAALVALLLTVIAWPVAALTRRRYGVAFPLSGRSAMAHRLVRVAAVGAIATLIGFALLVLNASSGAATLGQAQDGILWTLQIAALLSLGAGTPLAIWNVATTWSNLRSWYRRIWSIVIAAAFMVLLWLALVAHLIAFDVNY